MSDTKGTKGPSFEVTGSNGVTKYQIYQAGDKAWVCSCPAWKFQKVPGNQRVCKHIRKVFNDMAVHVALHS